MALAFDGRGLLAPGVHDAGPDVVRAMFGRFQKSDRRMTLFDKLEAYLREVRRTGWPCEVLIDGSFVMPPVDEPNDIDIVLVFPANWDMNAALRPFEYNVVSKAFTKRAYEIEVYPVQRESEEERKFLHLFSQVRIEWCQKFGWPPDATKGIVRVIP